MRKLLKRMSWALVFVGLAALSAHAVTLSVLPQQTTVGVGEAFAVDLVVSDLGGNFVGTFDIDVGFDSAVLTFGGYTLGSALGDVDFLRQSMTAMASTSQATQST